MGRAAKSIGAAVQRIRAEGYAVLDRIVDAERLARLAEDAEGLLHPIDEVGVNGERVRGRMFKGLFRSSRAFDDLIVHPDILAVVRGVLAPEARKVRGMFGDVQLATAMIKDVQPGQGIRALHQDDVFFPLPRPHQPLVVNTLLAIDPFTVANGGTRVVPGSHRWGSPLQADHDFTTIEMDAGSILMFDGAMWHGRGPNTTPDRCRRALNLYYSCSWLRQLEGHYCGLPEADVARLPAPLQALL